jgi:ferredoxin
MVAVTFVGANGDEQRIEAQPGDILLTVAQNAGQPLEGTCEGQMACSTCHVIVAHEWFERLKPASEDEEDLLDLAAHATRTSRLSCQIVLDNSLDGLLVRIPASANDARR